MAELDPHKSVLKYVIHKYSSANLHYRPENILTDDPGDSSSLWCTQTADPTQYITLKLLQPAILSSITFGKSLKLCAGLPRKFLVAGGMDEHCRTDLLTTGLRNDNKAETFDLRSGSYFPCPVLYVKIILLRAWPPELSYSISFVEMQGDDDPKKVQNALFSRSLHREMEAVRLCLKHLRARHYLDAFAALQKETGVALMSAQLEALWDALVERGNFQETEELIDSSIKDGMIDWYLSRQSYVPSWNAMLPCSRKVAERLESCDTPPIITAAPATEGAPSDRDWMETERGAAPGRSAGEAADAAQAADAAHAAHAADAADAWERGVRRPCARGGHQLCCDSARGLLYLFGGWDGDADLGDLWTYSVAADRWTLIDRNSETVGGPSPRSCHKMVLDPIRRQIFTIGRYLDSPNRITENLKSDLYAFDIVSSTWRCVCPDTWLVGGPRLVFDHQMCIDSQANTIYVFGGRILPNKNQGQYSLNLEYSGLYAYHIPSDTWTLLLADSGAMTPIIEGVNPTAQPSLLARVGHSMLFHPIHRKLYIFAGQRNKEHLIDFISYNVDTGQVDSLGAESVTSLSPPAAGSTQRATLDPDRNEIYVLSGLSKERDRRVCNALWVFCLNKHTWNCVYRNDRKQQPLDPLDGMEPCPRFAHQLVYDCVNKVHYLFGGNPGKSGQQRLRLDDFWAMRLNRMTRDTVWHQLRALLRRSRYSEMALAARTASQAAEALIYLRESVHEVTQHSDKLQSTRYRRLASRAFGAPAEPGDEDDLNCPIKSVGISVRPGLQSHPKHCCTSHRPVAAAALPQVLGVDSPESSVSSKASSPEPCPHWNWDNEEEMEQDEEPDIDYNTIKLESEQRQRRIVVFEKIASHFPPSSAPPRRNLTDLVVTL